MNKILIVGRLTRDPEKNTTSSGISYVRFSIAVTRSFNKEQTDFIPVVAWRQSADYVANYLKKGYLVSIEGSFTSSRYQNAEQQMVTKYEISADRVQNLEPRRDGNGYSKPDVQKVEGLTNIEFEVDDKVDKKTKNKNDDNNGDVPWDIEF